MKNFDLFFSEENVYNKISYSRHLNELWYQWWNTLREYMEYFYQFIEEFKWHWYNNDIIPYLGIALDEITFNRRCDISINDIHTLQSWIEPPSLWLILKPYLYNHWKWEWYSRKIEQNIYHDMEIYYRCIRYEICIENGWDEYAQSINIFYVWDEYTKNASEWNY